MTPLVLIFLMFIFLSKMLLAQTPPAPPSEGAFYSGDYRNMLAEWGIAETEIEARIEQTWQQLFYGDDETERIYYPVGEDMAYILDIGNQDVRSEGMSYGLMVAVQLDKKERKM